jgi:hypothetical protein
MLALALASALCAPHLLIPHWYERKFPVHMSAISPVGTFRGIDNGRMHGEIDVHTNQPIEGRATDEYMDRRMDREMGGQTENRGQ